MASPALISSAAKTVQDAKASADDDSAQYDRVSAYGHSRAACIAKVRAYFANDKYGNRKLQRCIEWLNNRPFFWDSDAVDVVYMVANYEPSYWVCVCLPPNEPRRLTYPYECQTCKHWLRPLRRKRYDHPETLDSITYNELVAYLAKKRATEAVKK
jgi:hypothetical protein